LPSSVNRVFNLNSKQLVKVYSNIFKVDFDDMNEDLNKGDVSVTIKSYFKRSNGIKPASGSTLSIAQIDAYLDELKDLSKENEQTQFLQKISKKFTTTDIRMFVRLIKKDLRIDAGTKVILDAISPNAYAAFQASRDLKNVLARSSKPGLKKDLSVRIQLMTPVKPMLAEASKSVEHAFKKCPNGILAEVKYDGERLQVHKNEAVFNYYSRNLKQVQPHKVAHLKEFIPKAFVNAKQLILGEILGLDINSC
jgi:DNA ligase-3